MFKIANAPCSWGVLEFDFDGKTTGYMQVLEEIQSTGYRGTELGDWGFLPTDPIVLKSALQSHSLEMVAAFLPVDFSNQQAHPEGAENAIRTAKLLAAVAESPFIVLADDNCRNLIRTQNAGRICTKDGLSDEGWAIFTAGVEHVARAVRDETGVRCVFHHHCAGFVETPSEVEKLLSLTDPDLVGLCFDTGHYAFGGGDVIEGILVHADRIQHIHFKGYDPDTADLALKNNWNYYDAVRNGIFCELGKGNIDFPTVLKMVNKIGYSGWIVVEQDVLPGMGSPMESAARNRTYLRRLGL